jgi:hypothetical protein
MQLLPLLPHQYMASVWLQKRGYGANLARVLHVNVRHLVVAHGKRAAVVHIQHFAKRATAHAQQAGLAQLAVQVHRTIDRRYPVLADHQHARTNSLRSIQHKRSARVDFFDQACYVGLVPESLQVVVQVRQVAKGQRRLLVADHLCRRTRDPVAARKACHRPPESLERKVSQLVLELRRQPRRLGLDVKFLAAVAAIMRLGRHAEFAAAALVEPPEHLRGWNPAIQRLAVQKTVALYPVAHFTQFAPEPGIADYPMLGRPLARKHARLSRHGHRGKHTCHRPRRQRP